MKNLSQVSIERRPYIVNTSGEAVAETKASEDQADIETIFCAQYDRVARIIARVVRDPARAEELAVEVFLKLWRRPRVRTEHAVGWLCRAAVRKGLDELRRRTRRTHYESLGRFVWSVPTPEDVLTSAEEQERVRFVLAIIEPRNAELLILRSQGLSYDELASALNLKAGSVGTLLSRAQESFRKEFIKRYGKQ